MTQSNQLDDIGGNVTPFFAHSASDVADWHLLNAHLSHTAEIAASFGRNELEQDLFRYAGLLHDAGKYQPQFQTYLRNGGRRGSVPHAAHGAALSYQRKKQNAVSFAVLGHHSGLLDFGKVKNSIANVLKDSVLPAVQCQLLKENDSLLDLEQRFDSTHKYQKRDNLTSEFFIRYLFSALTDADWLDTEAHFSPNKAALRASQVLDTDRFIEILESHFRSMKTDGDIITLRNEVRAEVVSNAALPVGFFSLNVPTGLGKTLTSTLWALKHAKANALKRIIIVLPFINIIDQTAHVLSGIFGEDSILEHHSGVFDDAKNYEGEPYNKQVLATENWDYPIIVTTTVQFFESLFNNKPSKCRKIHNIADSVVIFDEVQTLPQELVLPTLEMLKQVQEVLNTSFLFSTATQPAFEARVGFPGLEKIYPLVRNPQALFGKTKRVDYLIVDDFRPVSLNQIASMVCAHRKSVLVIVNTKKDASRIFDVIKTRAACFDITYHLSTNMCPMHRKSVILSIREDLGLSRNICVISTQLIEAGVDFDFPVVYRALAPLESIIQSGGRCNREGRLSEKGKVFLFTLEAGGLPPGLYSTCTAHTKLLISSDRDFLDRHDSFSEYYQQVQSLFVSGDKRQISESRKKLLFEQVADSYHLIDSNTVPLFVRGYGNCAKLLERLQGRPFLTRSDMRALQPYVVNFFRQILVKHNIFVDQTSIPGIFIWDGKYDSELGVVADGLSVEELVL